MTESKLVKLPHSLRRPDLDSVTEPRRLNDAGQTSSMRDETQEAQDDLGPFGEILESPRAGAEFLHHLKSSRQVVGRANDEPHRRNDRGRAKQERRRERLFRRIECCRKQSKAVCGELPDAIDRDRMRLTTVASRHNVRESLEGQL
jgi:hypothetical protein